MSRSEEEPFTVWSRGWTPLETSMFSLVSRGDVHPDSSTGARQSHTWSEQVSGRAVAQRGILIGVSHAKRHVTLSPNSALYRAPMAVNGNQANSASALSGPSKARLAVK